MAILKQTTIDGSLTVKQVLNLTKLEVENATKINLLSQKENTVIGETANNINFFDSGNSKSLLIVPGNYDTSGPSLRFYSDASQTVENTKIGTIAFKAAASSGEIETHFQISFDFEDSNNGKIKFSKQVLGDYLYDAIVFGDTYDNVKYNSFGENTEVIGGIEPISETIFHRDDYDTRIYLPQEAEIITAQYGLRTTLFGSMTPTGKTLVWRPEVDGVKEYQDTEYNWYHIDLNYFIPTITPLPYNLIEVPGSIYVNKRSEFSTHNGRLVVYQDTNDNESGIKYISSDNLTSGFYYGSSDRLTFADMVAGSNGKFSTKPTVTMTGYVSTTVGNYHMLNFTGQHRVLKQESSTWYSDNVGKIVVSCGEYKNFDSTNSVSINESLPKILLSSKRMQKNVFGVISDENEEKVRTFSIGIFVSYWPYDFEEEGRVVVNSIGEGSIWVCNINGNLENGDYITTCEIPGYGMRQDEDVAFNYTVAKITSNCNFELENESYLCEEFEWEGKIYRKAFVGCTYHCG